MLPAPQDTILQTVTLHGAAQEVEAGYAKLKTALEHAVWPVTGADEILFLRTIKLSGNLREIATRAADQARRLARDKAVNGWSSAAPSAMAVRFRSRASLLACLIRDLLHDANHPPWYWRRWQKLWQGPADKALVSLLTEIPLSLPTVLFHLRDTPAWQPFWQALGVAGGEELLATVSSACGWYKTVRAARAGTPFDIDRLEQIASAAPLVKTLLPLDLSFLTAHPAVNTDDPRFMLGALLTLWQQAPTLLNQSSGLVQLRQLSLTIAGQPLVSTPHKVVSQTPPHTAPKQPRPANSKPLPDDEADSQHLPVARVPGSQSTQKNRLPGCPLGQKSLPHRPIAGLRLTSQSAAAVADASHQPFAHDFVTEQGGLFYLLNFLNLRAVQSQLATPSPPHSTVAPQATEGGEASLHDSRTTELGAGWRWLYGLAVALGCQPQGELLEFLAHESNLADGAELILQPPLPKLNQLLQQGTLRYGDEVWNSGTWQIPARLVATASHLDLHFRLGDVRLPIRRLGLDITPGWLPWLGRVVTFHYGSGLEANR